MENTEKIQEKLDELNADEEGAPWIEIQGYFSMLKTELNNSKATFHANSGLVVKGFLNTRIGEIRIFPANAFEKNN